MPTELRELYLNVISSDNFWSAPVHLDPQTFTINLCDALYGIEGVMTDDEYRELSDVLGTPSDVYLMCMGAVLTFSPGFKASITAEPVSALFRKVSSRAI